MGTLTVRTAGESHGPAVVAFIEGLPAGLPVDIARVNTDLSRRQGGYGRGGASRSSRTGPRSSRGSAAAARFRGRWSW